MVKPRIYVETSVISYLAARPSADAVSNARQFQSHCLWQARDRFELFASEAVQAECLAGDAQAARLRAEYVQQLPILQARTQAAALAQQLVDHQAVPRESFVDAVHIAVASVHALDLIASWNFKHIAGAMARSRIEQCLRTLGAHTPTIATPEEILEDLLP